MWQPLKRTIQKFTHKFIKAGFSLGKNLKNLFSKKIDESILDDFEKTLFEADLGAKMAMSLKEKLKNKLSKKPDMTIEEVLSFLKQELIAIFPKESLSFSKDLPQTPYVVMLVGVNGSGKTTTLAKLANYYKKQGKKVLIAAADTFRSAAVEQLSVWAEKLGCEIIKSSHGADPAAVVFDAAEAAISRKADVLLIDTAGRLQNKTDLMHELGKIKRVLEKKISGSPHETLLTLDATVGQNGLDQAEIFHQFTPLSGIILSKFDGTAKGGIIISIQEKLKIPVLWIGNGEKLEDFVAFDAPKYIEELLD